ncbi:MAG: 2-amino-4-hydroxy-6-hydroxymethyldihydropteridine diphosphokinase [Acidobacteria bacterium]|nr:2-amino-4-hydroxy-6-hydroxymethyldihydropteridine diphosphokinase [Acidobacteriota bacterium]
MKRAYLGLGSNLGPRQHYLAQAIARLGGPSLAVTAQSSIYETAPVGYTDQGWFLNMAVEIETTLLPLQLLRLVARIERTLGRQRTFPNGPRTLDIDILLYDRHSVRTRHLVIPHPRMTERRFVLESLAEIAPNLVHPAAGKSIQTLLTAVSSQAIRRWTPPETHWAPVPLSTPESVLI